MNQKRKFLSKCSITTIALICHFTLMNSGNVFFKITIQCEWLFSYTDNENGDSSQCLSSMCFSYLDWVKNTALGQFSQNSTPLVSLCTKILCFLIRFGLAACLPQISQVIWVWDCQLCFLKLLYDPNCFPQGLHSNSVQFSCTLCLWLCNWCWVQVFHLERLTLNYPDDL